MDSLPRNHEVAEIAALATIQIERQRKVEALEQELKDANESLRIVQETDLPNAMLQAGVSEIRLPNGQRITIKEDVYASIPKDHRYHEAMDWLRENGFGDIIKNEITVTFGKGEEESAQELLNDLAQHGWSNTNKIAVHPSTLKALIREQLAKGANIPLDVFGAYPFSKAIIK